MFKKSLVLVLTMALTVTGCTSLTRRDPETISYQDALAILERAVAHARSKDLDALCGMGGAVSLCQKFFKESGQWNAVPGESPQVVDNYVMPHQGQSTGGRVLVLEGVDGLGRAYHTEFLVFDAGTHGLVPFNPIYWSGVGMEQGE